MTDQDADVIGALGAGRAVRDELCKAMVKRGNVGPGVELGTGVGAAAGRFLEDEEAQGEDHLPVEHGVVVTSDAVCGLGHVEKVQRWMARRVWAQDLHGCASASREDDEEGLEVRDHAAKESFVVRHRGMLLWGHGRWVRDGRREVVG